MRNFLRIVIFTALTMGIFNVNAHAVSVKSMELTVNPLQLLNGKLPLAFRMGLTEKMALGLHFHGRFYSYGTSPMHGLGGGLSLKFYLSGQAISDSWYLEPAIFGEFNMPRGRDRFWGIIPTVIGGYTWVWDSGFVINLGLGAAYGHNFVESAYWDKHRPYGVQGLMATGEFSIGYSW